MFSELILAASKNSEGIHIYDLRLGTHLGTLGSTPIDTQYGFTVPSSINNSPNTPPWVLTIPNTNLNGQVYNLNWDSQSCKLKFPLPERLSCIASSPSGSYIFGGSYTGKIYAWVSTSGLLVKVWEAHYGAVTCLTVSSDESVLISGGEDANAHIWLLTRVLDITVAESHLPELTLSGHTMPLTSIHIGSAGLNCGHFFSGRVKVFTSSKDQSCKCWEVEIKSDENVNSSYDISRRSKLHGELLTTWLLPSIIRCIVVDQIESKIFCGCQNGTIYRLDMYSSKSSNGATNYYAVGGKSSVVEIALDSVTENTIEFASKNSITGALKSDWDNLSFYGHAGGINAVSLSMDDKLLVSGSSDGTVKVWDVFSRQCIRTLNETQKKEAKSKSNSNPKIATTVNSGVCQVLVKPRVPEMGGVSGYVQMVKGGANVSYGSYLPESDAHSDVFKLNKANRLPQASSVKPPYVSILKRTRISPLDENNLLEPNDSKKLVITNLRNTRRVLRSVDGYAGSGVGIARRLEMDTTVAKDLKFSKQVLHEQSNLKTEDSLRDQLSRLHNNVSEISSKYQRLLALNDNLYDFTVTELLRNKENSVIGNYKPSLENSQREQELSKPKKSKSSKKNQV